MRVFPVTLWFSIPEPRLSTLFILKRTGKAAGKEPGADISIEDNTIESNKVKGILSDFFEQAAARPDSSV
jgi:hypothetical protein